MRLATWLKDKSLISAAQKLAANRTFQEMVKVLESESPLIAPLSPQGPTADDRSHRLGLIEGYNQCLTTLRQLWTPPEAIPPVLEATFEDPNQ